MSDLLNKGVKKLTPLIPFDCIVDTDVGLIQLVNDQYMDRSVFNVEMFDKSLGEMILDLYFRKVENPLYIYANPNIEHEVLDEYYKEFFESKYDLILERSPGTEMQNVIELFQSTGGDVFPTVLCKDDMSENFIKEALKIQTVRMEDINEQSMKQYTHVYFKYITQMEQFEGYLYGKFVYNTTHRLNLNDDNDKLKEYDFLERISKKNSMHLLDLYKISKIQEFISKEKGNNTDE
jgi:sugar/nucleoside kinase (ribokinase family)